MAYYVYIIQSEADLSYYKGFSETPVKRLADHNAGNSIYTSTKTPWKLVYVEQCLEKSTALKREKALKKYSHQQIENLIQSSKNILSQFL